MALRFISNANTWAFFYTTRSRICLRLCVSEECPSPPQTQCPVTYSFARAGDRFRVFFHLKYFFYGWKPVQVSGYFWFLVHLSCTLQNQDRQAEGGSDLSDITQNKCG